MYLPSISRFLSRMSANTFAFLIVVVCASLAAVADPSDAPDQLVLEDVRPVVKAIADARLPGDHEKDAAFLMEILSPREWKDERNNIVVGQLKEVTSNAALIDFGEGPQRVLLSRLSAKSRNDIRRTVKAANALQEFYGKNTNKILDAQKKRLEEVAKEAERQQFHATFGLDLDDLPENAISVIDKHQDVLVINSLADFSEQQCRLLTRTTLDGIAIEKGALCDLTKERAAALASSSKPLNVVTAGADGDVGLPHEVVRALAATSGNLYLPATKILSEDSALALSGHEGVLGLPAVTKVTPDAAVALCLHKGGIVFGDVSALRINSGDQAWGELKKHPAVGSELESQEQIDAMKAKERLALEEASVMVLIGRQTLGLQQPVWFETTLYNHSDGEIWCTMELRTVLGNFDAWLWSVRPGGSKSQDIKFKERFFNKEMVATCDVFVQLDKLTKNGADVLDTERVVIVVDDTGDPEDFDRFHVPASCTKVHRSSLRTFSSRATDSR